MSAEKPAMSPSPGDYDPHVADAILRSLPDDDEAIGRLIEDNLSAFHALLDTAATGTAPKQEVQAGLSKVLPGQRTSEPETNATADIQSATSAPQTTPDHGPDYFRQYFGGTETQAPTPDAGAVLFRIDRSGYAELYMPAAAAKPATAIVAYGDKQKSADSYISDENNASDDEELALQRAEDERNSAENMAVRIIRNLIGHCLTEASVDGEVVHDLKLAVSELLTNAVRHAKWQEVGVYRSGGRLVLAVRDNDRNDKGEQSIIPGVYTRRSSALALGKLDQAGKDSKPNPLEAYAKGDDTDGLGDCSDPKRTMHGRGLGLLSILFARHGYQRVYHPRVGNFATTKTVWVMTNDEA